MKHSFILSPKYVQFNGLLHQDLMQYRVFPALFWVILFRLAAIGVIWARKRKKTL